MTKMGKSTPHFKIPRNTASSMRKTTSDDSSGQNLYKYSVYMQSKSSAWLNRNLGNNSGDDDQEPIEEDIRD
jgi:hypothetical protein